MKSTQNWEEGYDWRKIEDALDSVEIMANILPHQVGTFRKVIISFIRSVEEKAREEMKIKNAGFYRQLFAEMEKGRTFTAEELYKIFEGYQPLDPDGHLKKVARRLQSLNK